MSEGSEQRWPPWYGPAALVIGLLAGVIGGVIAVLLVEGGASVAHDFHVAGLVDRYVLYLAPVLFGGDDGRPIFAGPGAGTIGDVWKGRIVSIEQLGEDLRVEVAA